MALSDLDILEKNFQKQKKVQKTDDEKKKVIILEKAIDLISNEKQLLANLEKEEIEYQTNLCKESTHGVCESDNRESLI